MELHLNLVKQWFDKHLQDKNEEYRLINPYWCSKLLLVNEERKSAYWWSTLYFSDDEFLHFIEMGINARTITFIKYKTAIYSNGMKTVKILPRFSKTILNISIGTGETEWGAEDGVKYFVIKHGDIINRSNC